MKRTYKILFALAFALLLSLTLFTVWASEVPATEGYVPAEGGKLTNIKWKISEGEGAVTLSFEIDPAASDKIQTTVLYGVNTQKGSLVSHGQGQSLAWGAYQGRVTHISIGDGITEINGGIASSFASLLTVELPQSLNAIKNKAFVGCVIMSSIYIRGNEPTGGVADLSNVTALGNYIFDNCKKINEFKLSASYSGALEKEVFKWTGVKNLTIPKGVTSIGSKAFGYCKALERVWCYAESYTIEENIFDSCDKLSYVYGIPGTPLESYCRKNDISFININNTNEFIYKSTKEPDIFDPTGATAYGNIINTWNGGVVVDVYWLYYEDTKTLKFVSNKTGHNETGNCSYDEKNHAWEAYKGDIETVLIGKGISKISQKAFQGMTALKTVRTNGTITQIDANAFDGCTDLRTIYIDGKDATEGTADLTGVTKLGDNAFRGTDVRNFILSVNTPTMGDNIFPGLTASITCTPNDELIAYAEENFVDIIDISSGETVSKNYVYVDTSLPFCGNKAVYTFDEATGTLTVSGVGAIGDIVNYYGGGSKNQYWFSFKQQIKKVIIEDGITAIGKYSFTQCMNLEYVEIPDKDFVIGNAAFESCENLKSVYRRGNKSIIGHADLSRVEKINSWTFSKCYLLANISLNPLTESIGASVFDTTPNLRAVYGTPGTYAESFASENNLAFFDASANTPEDTECVKPSETTVGADSMGRDTSLETVETSYETADDTEEKPDVITRRPIHLVIEGEETTGSAKGGFNIGIAIGVAAAIVLCAVIIFIIKKKK